MKQAQDKTSLFSMKNIDNSTINKGNEELRGETGVLSIFLTYKRMLEKVESIHLEERALEWKWKEMLFKVSPLTPSACPFQLKPHLSTAIIIPSMLAETSSKKSIHK